MLTIKNFTSLKIATSTMFMAFSLSAFALVHTNGQTEVEYTPEQLTNLIAEKHNDWDMFVEEFAEDLHEFIQSYPADKDLLENLLILNFNEVFKEAEPGIRPKFVTVDKAREVTSKISQLDSELRTVITNLLKPSEDYLNEVLLEGSFKASLARSELSDADQNRILVGAIKKAARFSDLQKRLLDLDEQQRDTINRLSAAVTADEASITDIRDEVVAILDEILLKADTSDTALDTNYNNAFDALSKIGTEAERARLFTIDQDIQAYTALKDAIEEKENLESNIETLNTRISGFQENRVEITETQGETLLSSEYALVMNVWNSVPNTSTKKNFAGDASFAFSIYTNGYDSKLFSSQLEGHYQFKKFDVGAAFNYATTQANYSVDGNETEYSVSNHMLSGIVNLGYYDYKGLHGGGNFGGGVNLSSLDGEADRYLFLTGANFGYYWNLASFIDDMKFTFKIRPEGKFSFAYSSRNKNEGETEVPKVAQRIYARLTAGMDIILGRENIAGKLGIVGSVPIFAGATWNQDLTDTITGSEAGVDYYVQTGLKVNILYSDIITSVIGYQLEINPEFITNSLQLKIKFHF